MMRGVHGHKARAPPEWRLILAHIRERRWMDESGEMAQSHNGIDHTLDAMLHWRDPHERLRTIRRRRALIDDNPCSG